MPRQRNGPFDVDPPVRHGVTRAMVQGTGIFSLLRIALVVAALGALLLWAASMAHGDGQRMLPFLVDDCQSFGELPIVTDPSQTMAPHVSWRGTPAPRATPALWTRQHTPQPPLRGTGSDWIYIPFNGCTGSDSGDLDLRNPSGDEAVYTARTIGI
jgi:hypothetical protein